MVRKNLEHLPELKNNVQAMDKKKIEENLNSVSGWKWDPEGTDKIRKTFSFDDFSGALKFANALGEVANEEDHHPDLLVQWGKVTVTWTTHSVNGLSENDFIMARNTDQIYQTDF